MEVTQDMVIDQQTRRRVHEQLEAAHGEEVATVLTEHLPTEPLATRADIEAVRADVEAVRADVERLEAATKAQIAQLEATTKAEIGRLEAETKTEFVRLEGRMEQMHHEVIGVFRGELLAAVTAQTKTLALTLVGVLLSFGVVLIAGLQLT